MATTRRRKTRRRKRQAKKLAAHSLRQKRAKNPITHRGGRREWRGDGAGRIRADRHKRYLAEVERARAAARIREREGDGETRLRMRRALFG